MMTALPTVIVLTGMDRTADSVVSELNNRGVPVARFNLADFAADARLTAYYGGGQADLEGEVRTPSRVVDLTNVRSLYFRRPTYPQNTGLDPFEAQFVEDQVRYGFSGVLQVLPGCLYVNHPRTVATAEWKPAQLRLATRLGFAVPPTIITNQPGEAVEFAKSHGPIVYKLLAWSPYEIDSEARMVWVREVDPKDLDHRRRTTRRSAHPATEVPRRVGPGLRMLRLRHRSRQRVVVVRVQPRRRMGMDRGRHRSADLEGVRRHTGGRKNVTDVDWRPLAETLTTRLAKQGLLEQDALRRAFAETPRHLFVPEILDVHHDENGQQHVTVTKSDDPDWLERVYSDEALVTQVKPLASDPNQLRFTSSSTMPSLMADMINELDIRPGMSILEIGTGTGYNAAILCRLLGEENVTTIDIDPELVEQARARLDQLEYHPSFEATNGGYDRVLATHSVDNIPYEWVRWCRPGAVILTDLRSVGHSLGAWAKLTVQADGRTARGRLMPDRGGFMPARTTVEYAAGTRPSSAIDERTYRGHMLYPADILDNSGFAFTAWRARPTLRWARDDDGNVYLTDPDRELWTNIQNETVICTLRGDLWAEVEDLYEQWEADGKPTMDAYELEVDENGTHIRLRK